MRGDDLPIRSVLPELAAALDGGLAVLTAPPGTGKTTLVPLSLPGRVLVAEPRRIAARAAARRMAWMLSEPVGGSVGFTVRGEHVPGGRVQVVTTGVLLQRLQHDQELDGVDTVVIDECHERHLDADTALAFLLEVRETLRPDLRILAASATADAGLWSGLLGGAPVVTASSVLHPLTEIWAPPLRPVAPAHGLRVDPALLDHVAATVRRALTEREGDVLCFLPGVGELRRVAAKLGGLNVLEVHGQSPADVQDAVLSPSGERRVILATAVAESSLTIPGIRTVVDSGLAREPRTDLARGLGSLTTVRVSRAAAEQRAGRAAREAPGAVYRCWPEAERLDPWPQPEIALADLTSFALQAACWGDPDASGLALLTPPPQAAMTVAGETLRALGAVGADGRATRRGRLLNRMGVHPRLGRALLDSAPVIGSRRAAEFVALLSEPLPREAPADLAAAWRSLRHDPRWKKEAARLERALPEPVAGAGAPGDQAAGLVVALAFPERVARRRPSGGHLMASGTAADAPGSLAQAPWLAIAVADRQAGSPSARVRQAVEIDETTAREAAASLHRIGDEVTWDGRKIVARTVESLGAIELHAKPQPRPDPGAVQAALVRALRRDGLGVLTWTEAAKALRTRLGFLHRALGDPWPAVDDEALLARADGWLTTTPARIDVLALLRGLLPWPEASRLDELAPERLAVPSGSSHRVDYSGDQPVLAVKLQEVFGWKATPELAGVPVLLHLLSPAGRPAAVTADLASFWSNGYRSVRSDLRGRYPKHPWPEDPTTAEPTRHTTRRR
ncbi:ATP-dependent helicase HrpB [Actinocorallia longicatena]|uniref:ATP-dependent helicase HrpB n=1 Tax=Actinocorallia longicatena TaxID=111803 RepID=A0ABP6QMH2_9ACTN